MRIGVVKEIKQAEQRVALTPAGARELVGLGHDVLVEQGAGLGSALPDDAYASVGARIVPTAHEVWFDSELLVQVKEPIALGTEAEVTILERSLERLHELDEYFGARAGS